MKKIIMVVEDDEKTGGAILHMLENFLKFNKYSAIWAKNGLEALELYKKNKNWFGLKQNNIKCILLDLKMPKMDGVQFVTKLRELEKKNIFAQFTPVVFLTAWEDEEKWQSALDSFAAAYIKKPFTEEDLKHTLSKIIHDWDAENMANATHDVALKKLTEIDEEKKKSNITS